MKVSVSIADARDHLPRLVHRVERAGPVRLTRRGRPVAVLVSLSDYERLESKRPSFWDLYQKWRRATRPEDMVEPGEWLVRRDRSSGREVRL